MNKEDIITLEDNVEYMVLDIATINQEKYLFCVEIDEEEMPKNNYKYFQEINESNNIFVEEVEDQDVIEAISAIFTANHLNNITNGEQDV
ncbi:unknown [Mycoplasma sp. CAG:776]|nr:unknown [Mycoplasma sp. CAG:776]